MERTERSTRKAPTNTSKLMFVIDAGSYARDPDDSSIDLTHPGLLWCAAHDDEAPVAARDQYAALLPVRERVSGAEHPTTLIDRSNYSDRPQQPRGMDRGGGGSGGGPRSVRGAAAGLRAGARRRAPRDPEGPRGPRLLDPAGGQLRRIMQITRHPANRAE